MKSKQVVSVTLMCKNEILRAETDGEFKIKIELP